MKGEDVLVLVKERMAEYLVNQRFTGQLQFTLHCRDGGVGKLSLQVNQDLVRKSLQNHGDDGILEISEHGS